MMQVRMGSNNNFHEPTVISEDPPNHDKTKMKLMVIQHGLTFLE